jgi:hypothetical protein
VEIEKITVSKEKSGPKPIIVPIVLKMAEFDHKVVSFFYFHGSNGYMLK